MSEITYFAWENPKAESITYFAGKDNGIKLSNSRNSNINTISFRGGRDISNIIYN